MNNHMKEKKFLDKVQTTYTYKQAKTNEYQAWKKKMYLEMFLKYISKPAHMLELGCAWGESTAIYAPLVDKLVCVEGSNSFIEAAKENVNTYNVEFINCLFEEIEFKNEFDYIAANFILEHVDVEHVVLRKCFDALKEEGLLFVSVPNATSFTRELAVEMNFIKDSYDLTESDRNHGHRRIYDETSIISILKEAGFEIIEKGVSFIKPFAEFQMEAMADADILGLSQWEGLRKLAQKYPKLAEAILVVAKKKQ